MAKTLRESAFCASPLGAFIESPLGARGCAAGLLLAIGSGSIKAFTLSSGAESNYIQPSDIDGSSVAISRYMRHSSGAIYVKDTTGFDARWTYFDETKTKIWTKTEAATITSGGSDYGVTGNAALTADGDLILVYEWDLSAPSPTADQYELHAQYAKADGTRTDTIKFDTASRAHGGQFAHTTTNLYGTADSAVGFDVKFNSDGSSVEYAYIQKSTPSDPSDFDYSNIGGLDYWGTSGMYTIKSNGDVFTGGAVRKYPLLTDSTDVSVLRINSSNAVQATALPHASNGMNLISLTPEGDYLYVHDGTTLYRLNASDLTTDWTATIGLGVGTAVEGGGFFGATASGSGTMFYYNAAGDQVWMKSNGHTFHSGRGFDIQ